MTKTSGRIIKLNAKQEMAGKAYITWDIVIKSIGGLKDKTFKYELINSTTNTIYGTGNFENVSDGDTITLSNKELLDYNVNYEFTLYLWIDGTIGNNPISMANQVLDFDINCNITGTDPPTLAETISNLYTSATKEAVTNNSITYNYATEVGLMNDRLGGTTTSLDGGNIRYYGKDPNNYIYFNCDDYSNQSSSTCELWRIIGVFDDKIKIIRSDSIGNYSWDYKVSGSTASYSNDWSSATLKALLNETYYNAGTTTYYNNSNTGTTVDFTSTGIKNDTTRNLIAESSWNIGGWNSYSVYSNQIYTYERGTTVYSGRPTVWIGKVALMYPSDYGYATDFTKCSNNLYSYDSSTDSYACRTNDWLFNSSVVQWLLTPHSGYSNCAWYVYSAGYVGNGISAYYSYTVRPVLYLSSSVAIESGTAGTSSDPYKLSL